MSLPAVAPQPPSSSAAAQPPVAALVERFAAQGLRALVNHQTSVQGAERIEDVYELFRARQHDFLAVVEGQRLIGLVGRRQIGMLLGARYGFALFARKPIRDHLMPSILRISVETPLNEVFAQAFSRTDESYYDDAVLVDEADHFLGLIDVQTLVRLQHEMLIQNIDQVERARRELAAKNRQIEDDLRLARELQFALLPDTYPRFPTGSSEAESALRFAHAFEPSGTIGGDFFFVRALSDETAVLFICDVMGHDVRAALVTAMIRALVEESQALGAQPAELLDRINVELRRLLRQAGGLMFATGAALCVNVATGEVRYALAGHPPPTWLHAATGLCQPLHPLRQPMGPALGIFEDPGFESRTVTLEPGDRLVLFTDGLFEAMDSSGRDFGQLSLLRSFEDQAQKPLGEWLASVVEEVKAFSGGAFDDDVCLLGVEVSRIGAERPVDPAHPAAEVAVG